MQMLRKLDGYFNHQSDGSAGLTELKHSITWTTEDQLLPRFDFPQGHHYPEQDRQAE